jgi:hypothetical protein
MYEVRLYDGHEDTQGFVIQSPYGPKISTDSRVIQKTVGIPDFRFSINLQNPGWNRIRPLKTLVRVFNTNTGKQEFGGRILRPTQSMTVNGLATIQYEAEGFLAYLQDSNQRHGEYRDMTVREFFQVIVDNHNRQVEPHKKMQVGDVTVTNTTDNVYRYLGYEKTFPTIQDKLIDRLGGYLKLREESDVLYLDYLENVGESMNEPIRLGRNLKDMQREIDPTNVITRLIPLGARIESDDPDAVDASQARITIAEVNNGIDYIDDPDLIGEFGIFEGEMVYDDINVPSILKTRGEQFLASQKAAKLSYQVTPVDLSSLDQSLAPFEVDNYYPIVNPLFDIDEVLQVIKKTIYVSTVNDIELVIGDQYRTLTQYQVEANKRSKQVVELQSIVDGQSQRLATIQQEVKAVDSALGDINEAIGDADIPALEESINNLNQAVSDLIDAVDAIPDYDPATPEMDGLMSAIDKIKLNLITLTEPVNLDNLVHRVEVLEGGGNQG